MNSELDLNRLTTLPDDIFSDLTSLVVLYVSIQPV